MFWDVGEHYGIGSNFGMFTERDGSDDLCSGSDVYVSFNDDFSRNGHLLQDETIGTDDGVRVDDNSIGMNEQQSAPKLAAERNVSPGHNAPEAVLLRGVGSDQQRPGATSFFPLLIGADAGKEALSWFPKLQRNFSAPVRDLG
jgi:hypothetical protein